MRTFGYIIIGIAGLSLSLSAQAQRNFFNGGGVALYNPIVDVVNSGTQLVVSPTVSADRKYVTLSTVAQASQIVKIENFPFFGINNAFAGGAGSPASDNRDARPTTRPYASHDNTGLLQRPGMTFVCAP